MKRRITALALLLLFSALAVVSVALHHDHKGGDACPHKDCVACAIHFNCITTVPLVIVVFTSTSVEFETFGFEAVSTSPIFYISTASRAPPASRPNLSGSKSRLIRQRGCVLDI